MSSIVQRLCLCIHFCVDTGVNIFNRNMDSKPKTIHLGNVCRSFLSPQMWCRALREAIEPLLADEFRTLTSRELGPIVREKMMNAGASKETAEEFALEVLHHCFTKAKSGNTPVDPKAPPKDPLSSEGTKFSWIVKEEVMAATERKIAGKDPDLNKISEALKNDRSLGVALWGRMMAGHPEFKVIRCSHLSGVIGVQRSEADIEDFVMKDDLGDKSGAAHLSVRERRPSLGYGWIGFDVHNMMEYYGLDKTIEILTKVYQFSALPHIRGVDLPVPCGLVEIGRVKMEWSLAFQPPIASDNPAAEAAQRLRAHHDMLKTSFGSDISVVEPFGLGIPVSNGEEFIARILRERLGGK